MATPSFIVVSTMKEGVAIETPYLEGPLQSTVSKGCLFFINHFGQIIDITTKN
jgi:hypothetical protein